MVMDRSASVLGNSENNRVKSKREAFRFALLNNVFSDIFQLQQIIDRFWIRRGYFDEHGTGVRMCAIQLVVQAKDACNTGVDHPNLGKRMKVRSLFVPVECSPLPVGKHIGKCPGENPANLPDDDEDRGILLHVIFHVGRHSYTLRKQQSNSRFAFGVSRVTVLGSNV